MIYDLTEKQFQALKWITKRIEDGTFQNQSFIVVLSSTVGSPDAIVISGIDDLPDYINAGALEALSSSEVLDRRRVNARAIRYTLKEEANYVSAFDFNNLEPNSITLYIKKMYPLIKDRFDLQDFEELCFLVDVDPDRDIKHIKNRELELLKHLARVGRLQELTPILQKLRSNYNDWLPYPHK